MTQGFLNTSQSRVQKRCIVRPMSSRPHSLCKQTPGRSGPPHSGPAAANVRGGRGPRAPYGNVLGRMLIHIYMYTYVNVHADICRYEYMYIQTCVHKDICVPWYVCMHACMHVYVNAGIRTLYPYTFTYAHKHAHTIMFI